MAVRPSPGNDPEGRTTRFVYDELNRLVRIVDPLGDATGFTYDDRDNLLTLEDPNNGVIRFAYDRMGRLTKITRPLGQETRYEYDPFGNLIASYDAKGQKIAHEYDAGSRPTVTRYFAAGDLVNPVKTITFTYDDAGNLTGYDDGTTSAVYTYDALGRKLTETVDYGPFTKTHAYTYYTNGLKKTYTGPDGVVHEYAYDDNNRLTAILIAGVGPITTNGYRWNRPTQRTFPGGSTQAYGYDPLMRLRSWTVQDPAAAPVAEHTYGYSPGGNVTDKVTEHGAYTYGYDALGRLTSAVNPSASDEGYTYDGVGNRLTSSTAAGPWSYNDNNELLAYDGVTFAYDANGNRIRKTDGPDVTVYVYDVADRLIRVEDDSGTVIARYGYDPFGRRLWKEVGGVRTCFAYAEEGLIGEYDATGTEIKTYGYEPDSLWTTNPLYQKVGGQYYWYLNDHAGTPQKLTDTAGRVVWSAVYEAFGRAQVLVADVENNLRLPGQYYDAETGLHYNWFRSYDPATGRYLRLDPLAEGLNHYAYALGNPIGLVDPEGLHVLQIAGGIGQIALGVATVGATGGVGTAVGVLAIANGVNNIYGGMHSLISGAPQMTPLQRGVYSLTGSGTISTLVQIGVDIGTTAGAGWFLKQAKTATALSPRKPIVIGENMKRVQKYADDIGGHAYRPWRNDPFDRKLSMKRNTRWIKDMKREGREIVDIGPDFNRRSLGRPSSYFYNMERSQTKGYSNYKKAFVRSGKNSGGVPGFDF